jgi:transposase
MWGEYKTPEGAQGVVDISFGYSKQNRQDKKQIKLSRGTTEGICIDGQVQSGNQDDKRFNIDNLDRAAERRERFESAAEEFF